MRSSTPTQIRDLRRTIDCLPRQTREAMLEGIEANTIVVGAYSTTDGVCPMLAAHRSGGRTSYIAFAKAWDEYCFRGIRLGRRRARPATRTELATLRAHLETSLMAEEEPVNLRGAMAEHHELKQRHEAEAAERETRERRRAARLAEMRAAAEAESRRESDARLEAESRVEGESRRDVATPGRTDAPRPGDPDRSEELRKRNGWRWMRVVRTYDEYRERLEELESEDSAEALRERLAREREISHH